MLRNRKRLRQRKKDLGVGLDHRNCSTRECRMERGRRCGGGGGGDNVSAKRKKGRRM